MNLALAVLAGTGYLALLFELQRLTLLVEAVVVGMSSRRRTHGPTRPIHAC